MEPPDVWRRASVVNQGEKEGRASNQFVAEDETEGGPAASAPAAAAPIILPSPYLAADNVEQEDADAFTESILDQEDEHPQLDEGAVQDRARRASASSMAPSSAAVDGSVGAQNGGRSGASSPPNDPPRTSPSVPHADVLHRLHVLDGMQQFVLRRQAITRTRAHLAELYGTDLSCFEQYTERRCKEGGFIIRPTDGMSRSPAFPKQLQPAVRVATSARELQWALGLRCIEDVEAPSAAPEDASSAPGPGPVLHENGVEPLGDFMVAAFRRRYRRNEDPQHALPTCLQEPNMERGAESTGHGSSVFSKLTARNAPVVRYQPSGALSEFAIEDKNPSEGRDPNQNAAQGATGDLDTARSSAPHMDLELPAGKMDGAAAAFNLSFNLAGGPRPGAFRMNNERYGAPGGFAATAAMVVSVRPPTGAPADSGPGTGLAGS